MSAYSRVDLNIDQDRNDETRNLENFDDGDFPELKSSYDRQAYAHHSLEKFFRNGGNIRKRLLKFEDSEGGHLISSSSWSNSKSKAET